MSIALSAIVQPSRILRRLLLAAVLLQAGLACLAAPLALPCLLGALCTWRAAHRQANPRRIDISGLGELRLTVQQSVGGAAAASVACQLLPGSTLWAHCLLLRLATQEGSQAGSQAGACTVLIVLPDSVTQAQFRHLAVAIRSIAGRDQSFFKKHKIL